ncbi:putative Cytochrome oxidase assembly factor 4 [Glarea lozoyensis 74030]|uniref:Putative Cytochrome oxidase assembly factor 4 n=1 Tax=Glarea lozoyensis (strain ATCC 74030 / MF5533) TaxID=1104152 RepID=H0EE73_GLAL7|nr:putative Cytochrome oxidase assembly factor 4 [Glarea lozoyensis 74030]
MSPDNPVFTYLGTLLQSLKMSKASTEPQKKTAIDFDDEPDDWDKRIFSTGCAEENTKMNDCFYEKKDWRVCKNELENFKQCWKRQQNDKRTSMKDA